MSQEYFDIFVNRIGELANSLSKVIDPNKISNEEINFWVVED
jgi:hypothetical protein